MTHWREQVAQAVAVGKRGALTLQRALLTMAQNICLAPYGHEHTISLQHGANLRIPASLKPQPTQLAALKVTLGNGQVRRCPT